MKIVSALPAVFLLLLLIAAFRGKLASHVDPCESDVLVKLESETRGDKLFVMVPGLRTEDKCRKRWGKFARELSKHGDVAMADYPAHAFSNAKPELIAQKINSQVQEIWAKKRYRSVVLVGNSMGALIARKALLYSQGAADSNPKTATEWGGRVTRLVLLAGMNRGWDLAGGKPADMRWHTYYGLVAAAWFGNLTHSGQLLLQMESGAPFVANLRLEWMRWVTKSAGRNLEIVQLLGDIDEVVSADDNADLRVSGQGEKFVWLKVRGTGHSDILDTSEPVEKLGEYRMNKFRSAITLEIDTLQWYSEELPYTTDDKVTHVVFVLHGIRDLGEWSSSIETELRKRVQALPPNGQGEHKLAIASVRYGYFGMGQFLVPRDRQKYVRWFMDQYTETLARYPNAKQIDFIGHSNGTYLLGEALKRYTSMKVDRVVLGGSVLPKDYDWKEVFDRKQVQIVRNYVADDDWVVALFPRFFELPPMRWFNDDLGSAGFNGFDAGKDGAGAQPVHNIKFIQGGHSAFLEELEQIGRFLVPPAGATDPVPMAEREEPERSSPVLNGVSKWFSWAIWLLLVSAIVWLGSRVVGAAGHLGTVALILYLLLVVQVLRWA